MIMSLAAVGMSIGSAQLTAAPPGAPSQASVTSSTGTGTTTFQTSSGVFLYLTALGEEATPAAGRPGLVFPHGFFSFKIANLSSGGTTTITISLPSTVPSDVQYWMYGSTQENRSDHWYQMPLSGVSGDRITFTVKDGGLGDGAPEADGQITGLGGPGIVPQPPAPSPKPPPILFNETEFQTIYATLGSLVAALSTIVVVRKRRVD